MQSSGIEDVMDLAEPKTVTRMIEVSSECNSRSGRLSRRFAKSERALILSFRTWQMGIRIIAIRFCSIHSVVEVEGHTNALLFCLA